jgi:hypothetical protein
MVLKDGLFDVNSVFVGSPGYFGAQLQSGSLGTSAGSAGFMALRFPFTSSEYIVMLQPFSGTSTPAFTSGVQNATSGVNVVGGASGRYYWLAIGLGAN